ncbi:MAG TPA: hypothetical protein VMT34_13155, partial [Aggregatilineales bacterium]|nr:hypothetical protein [Aggregatilineales bacterium]
SLIVGLLPALWSRGPVDFTKMVVALPAVIGLAGLGADTLARSVLRLTDTDRLLGQPATLVPIVGLTLVAMVFAWTELKSWGGRADVSATYSGRLGHLAAYLDRVQDTLTTSICTLNLDASNPRQISDPALISLMMHHKEENLRFSNCLNGLVITRGGERQRFAYADPAAQDAISPLLKGWLKNPRPIPVAGLPEGTLFEFDSVRALADIGGQLAVNPIRWDPSVLGPSATAPLPVRMGDYLTFKGYQLFPGPVLRPGDTLYVVSYWRADGPQDANLRIFVHVLIDPSVPPVLQNDLLSIRPEYLADRDIFIQVTALPLSKGFAEGHYDLSVGAYHNLIAGQVRLPIYDQMQPRGDRMFLNSIEVLGRD